MFIEGTMTAATCLGHLSLCGTAHSSVSGLGTALLPGLGPHNRTTNTLKARE